MGWIDGYHKLSEHWTKNQHNLSQPCLLVLAGQSKVAAWKKYALSSMIRLWNVASALIKQRLKCVALNVWGYSNFVFAWLEYRVFLPKESSTDLVTACSTSCNSASARPPPRAIWGTATLTLPLLTDTQTSPNWPHPSLDYFHKRNCPQSR